MRKMLVIISGAAALLALTGCGSLPTARDAPSSYRQTLNTELIAVVESTATRTGTEVYWVNPPRKQKKE
jgi:hypothetical protein